MDFQYSLNVLYGHLWRFALYSIHVCLLATITALGKSALRHRRPHTPTRLDSTAGPQKQAKSAQTRKCAMTQAVPSRRPRRSGSGGVLIHKRSLLRQGRLQLKKTHPSWFHKIIFAMGVWGARSVNPTLALTPPPPQCMCHCSYDGIKDSRCNLKMKSLECCQSGGPGV